MVIATASHRGERAIDRSPAGSTGLSNPWRVAQVFMMCLPALRFAMGPFPPLRLDDRFLAATILAPLVLLAMFPALSQHTLTCRRPSFGPWGIAR